MPYEVCGGLRDNGIYFSASTNNPGHAITTRALLKAVPLQAWGGQEGSRKLRFPDFLTTAQDGAKVCTLVLSIYYF
jgi:hypothetical protein